MSKFTVSVEGRSFDVTFKSRIGSSITFTVDGEEYCVEVTPAVPATALQKGPSPVGSKSSRAPRQSSTSDLRAPMPGIISEVTVAPGATVSAGDVLVVIEAMKMENPIKATADGVVDKVLVQQGQEVAAGAVMVTWLR